MNGSSSEKKYINEQKIEFWRSILILFSPGNYYCTSLFCEAWVLS